MRRWVLAAGATALIVMPTVLAFFSGGFFDEPRHHRRARRVAARDRCGALAADAASASPTRGPPRARSGSRCCAPGPASRSRGRRSAGQAQDDLQRLLLYLGFFVAALALLPPKRPRARSSRRLLSAPSRWSPTPCRSGCCPGVFELERSASAAGRLEQPLTYWNAAGIAATIGFVLAARVAGDPGRPALAAAVLAAAAVPLGLGVYLSFARGALAALAVGLLVLVALAPRAARTAAQRRRAGARVCGRGARRQRPADRQVASARTRLGRRPRDAGRPRPPRGRRRAPRAARAATRASSSPLRFARDRGWWRQRRS